MTGEDGTVLLVGGRIGRGCHFDDIAVIYMALPITGAKYKIRRKQAP